MGHIAEAEGGPVDLSKTWTCVACGSKANLETGVVDGLEICDGGQSGPL
jgi:hypothetical protein